MVQSVHELIVEEQTVENDMDAPQEHISLCVVEQMASMPVLIQLERIQCIGAHPAPHC